MTKEYVHFYLAHKLKIDVDGTTIPQASWINIHKYYDSYTKPPEFIFSNFKLGSYTFNTESLMTLAVLKPGRQLEIYTLTNMFNVGRQKIVQRVFNYGRSDAIESISRILKISIEKTNINIIALDSQSNMLEIEFLASDVDSHIMIENVEPKTGAIDHYYVNQKEGRYVYSRNNHDLYVVRTQTDYIPKNLLKLDLKKTLKIRREDCFKDEHSNILLIFYKNLKTVTIFYLLEPTYKFSIDLDYGAQFGKTVRMEDIKYLSQHHFEGSEEFLTFFMLIKCDKIVRLVKFTFQQEYLLKAVEKMKVQNAGTFSQLLPATLKVTMHSVFQIEADLISMRTASMYEKEYVVTFESMDKKSLYVKTMNVEQKKMTQVNIINLASPIQKVDVSHKYPYYITIVETSKKINFYTKSGNHIAEFNLAQFISGGKAYWGLDLESLEVGCYNLFSNIFVILVDKYIITSMIQYDHQQQQFNLKLITREAGDNDLYYGKFFNSRFETGDRFFKFKNGRFLIKKADYFVSFEDYFDTKIIRQLTKETQIINNFHFKTFELRKNMTDIHPFFFFSLMEMNYFGTVTNVIKEYIEFTSSSEEVPPSKVFYVEYSALSEWLQNESGSDYRLDKVIENNMDSVRKLKELAENRQLKLTAPECLILAELLSVIEDIYNNKRFQDPFASLFIVQVKIFNMANRNIGTLTKQKSLRSKEVIWAIHSQQPDSLFDVCFTKDMQNNPQFMNWDYFRKFCVPLWFDDSMKLKGFVEKIALFQYKQNRNPDEVILWYILLDKLPVLLALYKSLGTEKQKMVTFLNNDFKTERWQSAAVKNAYKLRGMKEFLMSAAFFILGNDFEDAVNIIVNDMEDIQLGIMMCRLKENPFSKSIDDKPILKKLITDYFIDKGRIIKDPWLVSIGYSMTGQYVNSLNCFPTIADTDMTKKVDRGDWLSGFSPQPSSLHPTFFILRKLLTNSFKMKIELEGGATTREESNSIFDDFFESTGPSVETSSPKRAGAATLIVNFDKLYKNAMYYYLHTGDPVFGLCQIIKYKPISEDLRGLSKLLTKLYFDQILFECIECGDWIGHFPQMIRRIQEVCSASEIYTLDKAKEYIEGQLTKLKNPKFLVSWLLGTGKSKEALKVTEGLSLQVFKVYPRYNP